MRDTLLFTKAATEAGPEVSWLASLSGAELFPLVLIVNAGLMTWFAGRLGDWWESKGALTTLCWGFLGSALWIGAGAYLLGATSPTWGLLIFYIGSEIAIFLAMNLIWMLASDYFTEQDQQRYFPNIAAFGLVGVSLGSGVILLNGGLGWFSVFELLWGWAGLQFGLIGIGGWIITQLPRINASVVDDVDDTEESANQNGTFWSGLIADWRWIKNGNRYLGLFTVVTVCNFFLLGMFDLTLARGAEHLGTEPDAMAHLLAQWVFGFGLVAALFQWLGFPRLLNRLGVAKLNLGAPLCMLLGAFGYILFASDWLKPLVGIQSVDWLLYILVGVRICGWAAEFLFNQSLLPFIYGALPQAEEQRGRLFIEGPVTALTNGAVGVLLIGYFWAFADPSGESYGFRLDLLYFIGIIAAAVMWFWSRKMIPELSHNLLRRIRAGGSVNAHFQREMQVGGSQFASLLQQVGISAGSVTQQVQTLLNACAPTEAAPRLLMLLQGLAPDDPARAEVWQALLGLKALPELQQAWSDLVQQSELPVHTELQAAVSAMRTIGRSDLIQKQLPPWLQVAQQESLAVLLHEVQHLGLDASIQLAETLRTRLENNDFADASLLHLAAALGGDRFYPAIAQRLRQVDEADLAWEQLGELQFASHQLAFDAFGLLLGRAEAVNHPAYAGLTALIRAYPWLVWPLVWLLILPGTALPAELRAQRHLWPGLLQQSDPWRWADLVLFRAMLQDHPHSQAIAVKRPHHKWPNPRLATLLAAADYPATSRGTTPDQPSAKVRIVATNRATDDVARAAQPVVQHLAESTTKPKARPTKDKHGSKR